MKSVPFIFYYTPSVYDPYNNISFVELNKARRGELNRPIHDRVYNRQHKPLTAKIYIRRNSDIDARPKSFVWRIWKTPRLEDIVDEIAGHLGISGDGAVLYNSHGRIVEDPEDIYEGQTYVLGHHEPFDGQLIEAANSQLNTNRSPKQDRYQSRNRHDSRRDSMPRPESSFTFGDRTEIYSLVEHGSHEPPTVASPRNSDYGNYHIYRENEEYEETPWVDLDELSQKDRQMLQKHKERYGHRRSRSAVIYNQKDQTNPEAHLIYAFLNGQGLECQYLNFIRSQLQKGLSFILELVARRFNVKPSKLVNMDGARIHDVSELMFRGAYVLIPVGQSFRDTWYFLPDNAIDTSNDTERVRARSAQRDRYLQKQQTRDYKQLKMRQTAASRRYTAGVYSRGYSLDPKGRR